METAHARSTDPVTSHEAADSVKNITELQTLILAVLGGSDRPMDDTRIFNVCQFYMACTPQGCRSRRAELVRLGLVEAKDKEGISPTGRRANRWGLVSEGAG